eukprot:g999.t1
MGALCAGQRNLFMEEVETMKKGAQRPVMGSDGLPALDNDGNPVYKKMSSVRKHEVSASIKRQMSSPQFLQKIFDFYSVEEPGTLQPDEFSQLVTHLIEVDNSDTDGLVLRYKDVQDEYEALSKAQSEKVLEESGAALPIPKKQEELEKAKKAKMERRLKLKGGVGPVVRKLYKFMGLKKNKPISRVDFLNRFKIKLYEDALKVE